MKKWHLLLFTLLFIVTGCEKDDGVNEEFIATKIEKQFRHIYDKQPFDDIKDEMLEIFNHKIAPINSIAQLQENPVFNYAPEYLQEELKACDLEEYTLIIASTVHIIDPIEITTNFGYNTRYEKYTYYLNYLATETVEDPIEKASLIIDAILVKKMPDDVELQLVLGVSSRPSN